MGLGLPTSHLRLGLYLSLTSGFVVERWRLVLALRQVVSNLFWLCLCREVS